MSSDAPGTTVLASKTLSVAPGSTPTFVPVSFVAPPAVTAGTKYSIVAYSSAMSADYGWNNGNVPNGYMGGSASTNVSSPPSGTWSAAGPFDQAFKTFVTPAAPAGPTGQRAEALKKCKKKHSKKAKKKCKKKAQKLPV